MADRSHAHQTIPCKTPGCGGLAKCISSRLVPYGGWIARRRVRLCEACERKTKTTEFEDGVYTTAQCDISDSDSLPEEKQLLLFD